MKSNAGRIISIVVFILLMGLIQPGQAESQDLPEEAYICCIYGTPQTYTLSCEARAAVDWAAFFGYSITEYDLIMSLPESDNPEIGFVGYWNGTWGNIPPDSYGVHPPPVAAALREYGVPAEAKKNLSWDDLRLEIAADRPVIVWVIAQMWPGTAIDYTAADGQTTSVAHFEHTMILTGYNASSVRVVDPLTGATKYFYLDAFLKSWSVLGNRAILAGEASPTNTPTPHPSPPSTAAEFLTFIPFLTTSHTVIVSPGDSLLSIARENSTTWHALVRLNHLKFPYFIYPEDILLLPFAPQ